MAIPDDETYVSDGPDYAKQNIEVAARTQEDFAKAVEVALPSILDSSIPVSVAARKMATVANASINSKSVKSTYDIHGVDYSLDQYKKMMRAICTKPMSADEYARDTADIGGYKISPASSEFLLDAYSFFDVVRDIRAAARRLGISPSAKPSPAMANMLIKYVYEHG